MKKSTFILATIASFFAGVCLGFLMSPAKQGFGNTTNYFSDDKKEKSEKQETAETK